MNNKQYKNIIGYTIANETNVGNKDDIAVVKDVMNNCGVPFPTGTKEEVKTTLSSGEYIGWTECSPEEAQIAADAGYATVGINETRAFVVEPSEDVETLSATLAVGAGNNVSTVNALSEEEINATTFYAQANFTTDDGVIIPEESGTTEYLPPTTYYFVTYDLNGGSGDFPDQQKFASTPITIYSDSPYKDGYIFTCWVADNGGTYYPGSEYNVDESTTLRAFWEPIPSYTLTYNLNGGCGDFPSMSAQEMINIVLEDEPTREGYVFVKWVNSTGEEFYTGDPYFFMYGDDTLTAIWVQAYTITYDLNGGSGYFPDQKKEKDKSITLHTHTPDMYGASFVHWIGSDGNTYEPGATYSANADLTLSAWWYILPQGTLNYDTNGGIGVFPEQSAPIGYPVQIYDSIPSYYNYPFMYWMDENGGIYYPGDCYTITSSHTLTAQWLIQDVERTLTFNLAGGNGDFPAVTQMEGSEYYLCGEPTKTGNKFVKWRNNYGEEFASDDVYTFMYGDDTLTAVWELETYTLTFNVGDGASSISPISGKYLTSTTLAEEPIREGYVFVKWVNNLGVSYYTNDKYTFSNGNDTLTAVWECDNTYTITYDLAGGTGSFPTQTAEAPDTITIYSGKPTREGCEFAFWSSNISGTYCPGDEYDGMTSIVLSAVWLCTVTYDLNGGIGNIANSSGFHTSSIQISSNKPEKEGYTFVKWVDESNNEYQPKDFISLENGSIKLTAVWEFTGYIISYALNGGSGTFANQIKQHNVDITLHENKPTRSGYDFLCWEGKNTDAFFDPGDLYNVNKSEVMVAQWEEKVPITRIEINHKTKTIGLDETIDLDATVYPEDSSSKTVYWRSSNTSVATVGRDTGVVIPKKAGTATIIAYSSKGKISDSCTITVDDREKVIVEKDGDYFDIKFSNGLIWKSIGCDIEKNRSEYSMWEEDDFSALYIHEQRYVFNVMKQEVYESFSAEQLALIYRMDPLGVEYYLKQNACGIKNVTALCNFKDAVYIAIFGNQIPGKFEFTVDASTGVANYGIYHTYLSREKYYTNAEVLFGFHTIFDFDYFVEQLITGLFETLPIVSNILTGVDVYQALFHSGSFVGLAESTASSFTEDYVNQRIEDKINRKLGNKAKKAISWANNLLFLLADIPSMAIDSFSIPNKKDFVIYNKIKEQEYYRVIFEDGIRELSMEDIIELCNN